MRVKRYSIVLKGRVQDVGLRSRIISTAKIYGLRGYPPVNDIDGSVKMICEGSEELLQKFLKDIEIIEELPSGIRVEHLEKKEIPIDFPLPSSFGAVEIEELSNISKKLDIGNDGLKKIEDNTAVLKNMDTKLGSMDSKLGGMDTKLGNIDTKLYTKLGSIDEKLDTLPVRIAQALKER